MIPRNVLRSTLASPSPFHSCNLHLASLLPQWSRDLLELLIRDDRLPVPVQHDVLESRERRLAPRREVALEVRPVLLAAFGVERVRVRVHAHGVEELHRARGGRDVREVHVAVELLEARAAREDVREEVDDVKLETEPELDGADLRAVRLPEWPVRLGVLELVEDEVREGGELPAAELEDEERVHAPEAQRVEAREVHVWRAEVARPDLAADGEVLEVGRDLEDVGEGVDTAGAGGLV
ncbi:hypothetical protein GSI_14002 [Ganoderma sinense ZZ0214-1]|uniref:Uncharacterized protein n=1 Tax=Ganoderma sinense ZZ0214-1 TaxID=1077348 RepID=A0A2G8RRW1_9APHY|nr:hypothetical protein GSI_14002 [Ganoderma sinense ZZ0214-1]